jgi:hypothetical protein
MTTVQFEQSIVCFRGEAKTWRFTITYATDGSAVDCSTATCAFAIKRHAKDTAALVTKSDSDFTKTLASDGILDLVLDSDDTDQTPASYVGQLDLTFSASHRDFSDLIAVEIKQAVIEA